MSDHESVPRWAELARAKWTNRGAQRPPFAEEPGPGQESVWDYPRPPVLVADDRRVRVVLGDQVVAETRRALKVLETSHPPTFYLPPDDVDASLLRQGQGASRCEWKGTATYWDVGDITGAVWSYEAPFPEFAALKSHLAFYPSRFACFVDEHRVVPQPGGFYAGWITPDLAGPFKGNPGSGGW
ncbi:MAG: DUF427 domain-containing protein [Myxococcota bacterium]